MNAFLVTRVLSLPYLSSLEAGVDRDAHDLNLRTLVPFSRSGSDSLAAPL